MVAETQSLTQAKVTWRRQQPGDSEESSFWSEAWLQKARELLGGDCS